MHWLLCSEMLYDKLIAKIWSWSRLIPSELEPEDEQQLCKEIVWIHHPSPPDPGPQPSISKQSTFPSCTRCNFKCLGHLRPWSSSTTWTTTPQMQRTKPKESRGKTLLIQTPGFIRSFVSKNYTICAYMFEICGTKISRNICLEDKLHKRYLLKLASMASTEWKELHEQRSKPRWECIPLYFLEILLMACCNPRITG